MAAANLVTYNSCQLHGWQPRGPRDAPSAVLATGLLASIEGGMVLSQARQDISALRVAVAAGLGQVRAQGN